MSAARAVVAALVALVALPFLASPYFPGQDTPAHLDTARLARLLAAGAPTVSAFAEPAAQGLSNAAAPALLALLARAAPPATAEWLLAALLTALCLGALLLAVRLARAPWRWAAVGAPLAAPFMLYMGSISLVLAYALAFAALAFAARFLTTGARAALGAFVALSLLAFGAQAQASVGILAATLGGLGVAGLLHLRRGTWRGALPRLLPLGLAALPALAALVVYQAGFSSDAIAGGVSRNLPQTLATVLLRRDVAVVSLPEMAALALVAALLALAALAWGWRRLRGDGGGEAEAEGGGLPAEWALGGALAVTGLVLVLPTYTETVPQIPERLMPVAHLMLFLWVLAARPPRLARVVPALAWAALALGAAGRTVAHLRADATIREVAATEALVPDGAVLLGYGAGTLAGRDPSAARQFGLPLRFVPARHLGRGLGGRDVANLANYQLQPSFPYFRVRLRPALAPTLGVAEPDRVALLPEVSADLPGWLDAADAASGRPVTHVLLRRDGLPAAPAPGDLPAHTALRRLLETRFEPVAVSAPAGHAELWRRR